MEDFCFIRSRNALATYLGVSPRKMTYVLFFAKGDKLYTSFEIPKKSGGIRTICAPSDNLKHIQQKLAAALQNYLQELQNAGKVNSDVSYAFEKKRAGKKAKNIISNASVHRNKRFVFNTDLSNFFGSFHFGRVMGYFEKNRYFLLPHEVAVTIAQLACYNGYLPQGAPSSPIITNLICQALDYRLLQVAKKYKLVYTRYADDITFSTNNCHFLELYDSFFASLKRTLDRSGFTINCKKTRIQYRDSRQEVTGLIVNKKVNVDKRFYKKTRAMAHCLYTKGEFTIDGKPGKMDQLEGMFSFIDQLECYNKECLSEKGNKKSGKKCNKKEDENSLTSREKQYQKFLYYKYFFANDVPTILTEGKTDVLYLKAALKSLHKKYPALVTKEKDGSFTFRIKFLKRTKRLQRFFEIQRDGADSLYSLYNFFTGPVDEGNYLKAFTKLSGHGPKNPTVILMDNERTGKKPLSKFINQLSKGDNSTKKEIVDSLDKNLSYKLVNDSKLFLLTLPLPDGNNECEMEDLLDGDLIKNQIDGREFDRSGKLSGKLYFNKVFLSKYIYKKYFTVDFSSFEPLLDALNRIVISSQDARLNYHNEAVSGPVGEFCTT